MKWKHPSTIKIYEALGTVADGRVEVDGDTAKVYSSSGHKYYEVSFDPEAMAIMSNDNSSYWQGNLGYPAVAYLLKIGVLEYRQELAEKLKGLHWKDLNQQFKNNFNKTLAHIEESLGKEESGRLSQYVSELDQRITELNLNLLGKKVPPPEGY